MFSEGCEVSDDFFCFAVFNVFEIPFAGTTVACVVEATLIVCTYPEGYYHIPASIISLVVIKLVNVVTTTSLSALLACKTDIEEVLSVAVTIVCIHIIVASIVKYDVACILRILCECDSVCTAEADIVLHACILDRDAVAMLLEFPEEVCMVSLDCSISTHVVRTAEIRSYKGLIYIS